jgi:hypothetical protein
VGDWRSRGADGLYCSVLDPAQINYRAQQLATMAERCNADLFEVLICQVSKDSKIDVVLGKALSVLPETELLEPVRNLLHRGRAPEVFSSMVRSRTGAAKQ